jgi:hypothetical protein
MSLTLFGVLALIGYYLWPAKPAVPATALVVPPVRPMEVSEAVAARPRAHGFDLLLQLQDALVAQGYSVAEVNALVAPIAPLLLSRKEPMA